MNLLVKITNLNLFLFITVFAFSQNNIYLQKQTIGLNLVQLSSSTIDINYEYAVNPYMNLQGDIGYSFNHINSWDLNFFLVPHIKCGNCGIKMLNQTGGFIKAGLKFNTRRTFNKRNYFFFGINLINSIVYEKADFTNYYNDCEHQISTNVIINPVPPFQEHTKYIFGIGTQFGFSFKIWHKLQSDLGLQIAFPQNNYKSLFGYENFISGIGYKDSYSYWFPTLIFNIKYIIN